MLIILESSTFAYQTKRKGKKMKFKFTDEKGNDYYVEISARDSRNLYASKKATQIVLSEIANMIGCAAYHWKNEDCKILAKYAQNNSNNIINTILKIFNNN